MFHECADFYYTNFDDKDIVPADIVPNVIEAYAIKIDIDKRTREERQEFELCAAQLLGTFSAYCKWWSGKDAKLEWVGVEEEIDTPIKIKMYDGTVHTIRIRGKIDGKLKAGKSKYMICDHKTKGRVNMGGITNTLPFDFQTNLYTWAVNEARINKNIRYSGVMYNVIKRTQLRLGAKESLSDYTKRVDADLRKRGGEFFIRTVAPIRKKQQDDFNRVLKKIVTEIVHFVLIDNGESIDRFSPPCLGPYGQCDLLSLCYNGNSHGLTHKERPFMELD